MDLLEVIKTRRSVRSYLETPIDEKVIMELIESAIWAPSSKNNQPWKFKIINEQKIISEISDHSIHGEWMKTAPCFIVVYLDKQKTTNYTKEVQSCGAAIQNILLYAHSIGLGSCWVGEVQNNNDINGILSIDSEKFELIGIITIGYYKQSRQYGIRKAAYKFLM